MKTSQQDLKDAYDQALMQIATESMLGSGWMRDERSQFWWWGGLPHDPPEPPPEPEPDLYNGRDTSTWD